MTAAVEVQGLFYRYPKAPRAAIEAVGFAVTPGERFALLGPNGCGKTTLLGILATLREVQQGAASVFGCDLRTDRTAARRKLGVVFQHPSLDDELTAMENLTHHGRLHGLGGAALRSGLAQAVERFDLASIAARRAGRLSGGQRRRVELAKALLPRPALLLMDEPTSGLDPAARIELWRLIEQLRRDEGLTVVLTTHLMDEAEACDRVAFLEQGRIAAMDSPAALRRRVAGRSFTVTARPGRIDAVHAALSQRLGDTRLHVRGLEVRFESAEGPRLVAELTDRLGEDAERLSIGSATLDDVFLQLTGRPLQA